MGPTTYEKEHRRNFPFEVRIILTSSERLNTSGAGGDEAYKDPLNISELFSWI